MGVSLKTEDEEYAGKTMQIRGSEGGRQGLPAFGGASQRLVKGDQGFTGTSMEGFNGKFLGSPRPASPIA
jgi:hypothetical protein